MAVPEPAPSLIPPIRRSTLVRSDREHVFSVFVREIGQWWPLKPLSAGEDRVRAVVVERSVGGRVYERWADGTEVDWGEILVWDPPERFAMTWESTRYASGPAAASSEPDGVVTAVELRFQELGPSLTRVELEHRGWDRLPATVACKYPGGYDAGWAMVLERLTHFAETA
jgi:hypothetical protein